MWMWIFHALFYFTNEAASSIYPSHRSMSGCVCERARQEVGVCLRALTKYTLVLLSLSFWDVCACLCLVRNVLECEYVFSVAPSNEQTNPAGFERPCVSCSYEHGVCLKYCVCVRVAHGYSVSWLILQCTSIHSVCYKERIFIFHHPYQSRRSFVGGETQWKEVRFFRPVQGEWTHQSSSGLLYVMLAGSGLSTENVKPDLISLSRSFICHYNRLEQVN